jgi:hypothetical protein
VVWGALRKAVQSTDDRAQSRSINKGLDLMAATLAPLDQPDLGSDRFAERHRRARVGFHRSMF